MFPVWTSFVVIVLYWFVIVSDSDRLPFLFAIMHLQEVESALHLSYTVHCRTKQDEIQKNAIHIYH